MGIYYYGISKTTRTIDGVDIAFSNFFGKAPSLLFSSERFKGIWKAFLTRSEKNATMMLNRVNYVMIGTLHGNDEIPIATWDGAPIMDDGYWDARIVGKIVRITPRKFKIIWYKNT